MARKSNKNVAMENETKQVNQYREHLKTITNGLVEMAKSAGRSDYRRNELLRESYNLVDAELDTFDGWKNQGAQVKKGQHAYLFWGSPIEKNGIRFCPVRFLFSREQVTFGTVNF